MAGAEGEPREAGAIEPATSKPRRGPFALGAAVSQAGPEDLVRGVIAVWLVLVLLALVFVAPTGKNVAAIASAKTLAIAVIAFYFGLHKGTPGTLKRETEDTNAPTPNPPTTPIAGEGARVVESDGEST